MQENKIKESLMKARGFMANNDLIGAKEEVERILEVDPENQMALHMLATIYFKLKEYKKSLEFWKKLLNENKDVPSLHTNLGLCYFKIGEYEKALEHFEKSLELNPTPTVLNYKGLTLSKMGDFRGAMEAFLKAGSKKMAEEMRKKLEEEGKPVIEEERMEEISEVKEVPKKMRQPAGEGFYHEEGILIIRVEKNPFYSRLQNLICLMGNISLKPLKKRFKGSETKAFFKSKDFMLFEITGNGNIFMGIKEENLYPLKIEDGSCYINEDFIIGFSSGLIWENGRIMAPSGEAINMASFTGSGHILMEVFPDVKTIELKDNSTIEVSFSKLIGWNGKIVPEEIKKMEIGEGEGIILISLKGNGEIFVKSEER
jgi:uncharacterized protein (AIM24 family)